MAFEGLTQRLAGTFKKLKNRGKLSEADLELKQRATGQTMAECMREAGADVEHPQRAFRQGFLEVGLQHGQADGALGTAVDFLGEAGGQLIEMAVAHAKRLSLSASLARTACSRSMPSSLHSSNR